MVTTNNKENNFLKLSIQVSLDGLSFCIVSSEKNSIVFYKEVNFQQQLDPVKILVRIEQEYEEEKDLHQEIDEVQLLFSNQLYSLVPSAFFEEKNASNYLKYNTKILKTDFIAHDVLGSHEITNVYIPYANIINYFFEKYGEFEYKHSISVLIETLLNLPQENEPKIYLNRRNTSFDLVVIESEKLLLCNSFSYDTPQDFLYYILFAAEQLNLDPLRVELVFLGELDEDSPLYKLIYQYVKNISSHKPLTNFDAKFPELSKKPEDFVLLNSL